jgi:serine/threonine protein kinase
MNFSAGYVDSVSSPGAMQITVERAGQNGQKASCPINPAYAPTPKEVMSVTVTSSMRSSSGGVTEQEKLSIEETKATMKFREIMFNEFQILEKLGSGQLGTVYLARWRGALVAVKKLDEDDMDEKTVDLFKKEAAALHVLSHHPALASFIGACWYSTPRTHSTFIPYIPLTG